MMVIRGRQGRRGLTKMSLSTFLDLVWVEIWDDVPPMGDKSAYRSVMTQIFVEGKEAHEVFWVDSDGKTKYLTDSPANSPKAKASAKMVAAEWQAKLQAPASKPDDVDSAPHD